MDNQTLNIVQAKKPSRQKAEDRRAEARKTLVDCAERRISAEGLGGLRARDMAKEMGCALGAIYNLVSDLDELVLLVACRTNQHLGAALDAAGAETAPGATPDDLLAAWARAYFRYAKENRPRWRALFEFRMPPGTALPAWFEDDQAGLFRRLEDRLAPMMPGLDEAARKRKARVLFSAVHGIVTLGLEDKFTAMPPETVEAEIEAFTRAYVRGLRAYRAER